MDNGAFDPLIQKYASLYAVPEAWIRAVIQTESSFDPKAYRAEPGIKDASYGLMQLLSSTARGLGYTGTNEGLYDPETNIALGTKLIAQIRQKVGDDAIAMYSQYNSGSPTKYLTSTDVAKHVSNFVANLQSVVAANPLIAGSGSISVVLIFILIWFWTKNKRK